MVLCPECGEELMTTTLSSDVVCLHCDYMSSGDEEDEINDMIEMYEDEEDEFDDHIQMPPVKETQMVLKPKRKKDPYKNLPVRYREEFIIRTKNAAAAKEMSLRAFVQQAIEEAMKPAPEPVKVEKKKSWWRMSK